MTDVEQGGPARATLQNYLQILRRQWWVTALVVTAALAAALIYTQTATPQYQSSMKIVVGQGQALFSADASGAVQPFTQTMTDLLQSDIVARRTIGLRRMDITPQQLLNRLSVTSNPDTSVLQVSYKDPDRATAKAVLTTLGNVFVTLVDEQQAGRSAAAARLSAGGTSASSGTPGSTTTPAGTDTSTDNRRSEPVSATVFDPAHAVPGQASPHVKRTIALALVLGLIGGLLLAFLRDALSGRIRSEDEAEQAFGAPVLAPLPVGVLGTKPSQVAFLPAKLGERVGESVQLLAASMRFAPGQSGGVVVVTSARPEDGKSSVVAHLATALAKSGAWVVAVEADVHRPSLHRLLDVRTDGPGLTEVLRGDVSAEEALVHVRVEQSAEALVTTASEAEAPPRRGSAGAATRNDAMVSRLELLPAGQRDENYIESLTLGTVGEMVARLRELGDYVIVDTPPVLLSGDAFPLLQLADNVVVVCREDHTSRDEAKAVRARLDSLGITRYSLVLTDSSEAQQRAYGYTRPA
jgi:capsular polysaccharide biosynthesis protein/Mrp family chromosome partitioning ATPase